MKYLGRYIGRVLGKSLTRAFITLPSCIRDNTVAWYKNLNSFNTISESQTITGLLDPGTDEDQYYISINTVTIPSNLTFSIKSIISSSGGTSAVIFEDGISAGFFLIITSNEITSSLYVVNTNTQITLTNIYNVTEYKDDILNISIQYTSDILSSVSVNGDTLTASTVGSSAYDIEYNGYSAIHLIETATGPDINGYGIYFYDVDLNSTHQWLGRPDGNLDSAWEDQIGSDDGTVSGDADPNNIDVTVTPSIDIVVDSIGIRTDDIYYGQYLDNTSGQINFYRSSGTFDYTDPSDGSLIEGVSIPVTGLYTIPINGICDIVTSDGSQYPICEKAGTVLHDILEDSIHISVDTPVWDESLYGSDYLNQNGFSTKTDSDAEGYDWTTNVDSTPIVLDDNTLIPLKKNDSIASSTLDTGLEIIL